jgi:hypothetical protein
VSKRRHNGIATKSTQPRSLTRFGVHVFGAHVFGAHVFEVDYL